MNCYNIQNKVHWQNSESNQEENKSLNIHYQFCQIDYPNQQARKVSQSIIQEQMEEVFSIKPTKRKLKTKGFLWKPEEDMILRNAVQQIINSNQNVEKHTWKLIALSVPGKTSIQCNQRWRKISNYSVKKKLSKEETEFIIKFVEIYGKNWHKLSELLGRCWTGKQIRDKYLNQLDPNINKRNWSKEEDEIIILKVKELGSKWKKICQFLPGRSENQVKNRYNNALKKQTSNNNNNNTKNLVSLDNNSENNNQQKNEDLFLYDIEDQQLYGQVISEGLEQFKEVNLQTQTNYADDSSKEKPMNVAQILQSSVNDEQKIKLLKELLKLN